jgi:hypothetical protein
MSYQITEIGAGKIVEIHVRGKLTTEAYEAFVPLTERRIEQFGKIRMLVKMEDFHGWTAGAAWEDLKFGIKHFSDIERLALVGDKQWEKGMAIFCKPFTRAKIRYFDMKDETAARDWLREGMGEEAASA